MSDEVVEGIPQVACALCAASVPRTAAYAVNGRVGCEACTEKLRAELDAQRPGGAKLATAVIGGLAGALVGAFVWAAIAAAVNVEVGYVAVLVGFLAGFGVKFGARGQRGPILQYIAAALSVVGLLAAKYMTVAYLFVKVGREHGVDVSYFDGRIMQIFPDVLQKMLSPFDILFLVLALMAAYRVPKAHVLAIEKLV